MGTISSISPHGTANTKTSPNATASAGVPTSPPSSSASGSYDDGSRDPLSMTSCPMPGKHARAAAADPAGADDSDPHDAEAYVTVSVPCMPACLCESTGQ